MSTGAEQANQEMYEQGINYRLDKLIDQQARTIQLLEALIKLRKE